MLGTFSRDHLEILMKAGEIVEPALETKLLDADPVVDEQFAGMSHTYLREELGVCLARTGFEVTAEGVGHQSYDGRYLLKVYFLREMTKSIVINGIDPLALLLGKIRTKPYRGQQVRIGGSGKGGKTFYQRNDPSYSFQMTDLFDEGRDVTVLTCADL